MMQTRQRNRCKLGASTAAWSDESASLLPPPPLCVQIALSSKLWRWGFFCLPFLWLVNYVFFRHALSLPTTPAQMKLDVRRSRIAFAVAALIWTVWLILFYTNRRGWAEPMLLISPSTNVLQA